MPELKNQTVELPIFGPTETTLDQQKAISESEALDYQDGIHDVISLVHSCVPIIYVVTHEENRFISGLLAASNSKKVKPARQIWTWSSYQGLVKGYSPKDVIMATSSEKETQNPRILLQKIVDAQVVPPARHGDIYILRDFHKMLNNDVPRILRDIEEHLRVYGKTIVIVAPILAYGPGGSTRGIEPSLDKQMTITSFKIPSSEGIGEIVKSAISKMKTSKYVGECKIEYTGEEVQTITRTLQGLTSAEAKQAIRTSFVKKHRLDVDWLLVQKRNIIKKSDILEYIEPNVSAADIGGMDEAKKFFLRYKDAYSDEAKKYGLKPLRGVLLLGIPGSGKSSLAKAVSSLWKLPLLRLDVGKVMAGLVGASESRMREAILIAESVSPCLLWVDEIEKALSGTQSSNFSDGGTLSRVFGTLLTAMQEGLEGVTIVATANDISKLPPELIRRFSESFFVDLPSDAERAEIFKIHIKKTGRDVASFDMKKLLKYSKNFTGAEIEKAVQDMLSIGWEDGHREIVTEDLITALKSTKPIAQVMPEKIEALREWARTRARYASSDAMRLNAPGAQVVTSSSGAELDVNSAMDFSDIEIDK